MSDVYQLAKIDVKRHRKLSLKEKIEDCQLPKWEGHTEKLIYYIECQQNKLIMIEKSLDGAILDSEYDTQAINYLHGQISQWNKDGK